MLQCYSELCFYGDTGAHCFGRSKIHLLFIMRFPTLRWTARYVQSFKRHAWHFSITNYKVKVKQSLYRLGHDLRVPRGLGSQISRQSVHEGGNFVSPTHRPPLTSQEIFVVLISVKGWVDSRFIARPEGLRQWKIPSGIEPATFSACSTVPRPTATPRTP